MSEFQYYEWITLDRPLTSSERAAVNKLSSHIDVSSTRAQVDYSWGDFKHDPIKVLAKYFDAFLYASNWGSMQLAFRYPAGLLDERALQPYYMNEVINLTRIDDSLIVEFGFDDEEGGDWIEAEGVLGALAPLRADLLAGDYRVLYLAWLQAAALEGDDEEMEPPVPHGLGELNDQLSTFVQFFGLDPHLVQAAASRSETLASVPVPALDALIEHLPRAECNDWLQRLASDEPLLSLQLNRRLHELDAPAAAPAPAAPVRTIGALHAAAAALENAENKRKRIAAAAQHKKELEALAARASQAWQEVDVFMEKKSAFAYDSAVELLLKLREVAVMQNDLPAFTARMAKVQERYARRPAFQERLHAHGLAGRLP